VLGGPKLSNFKIRGPKLQQIENRWTKTAIKPNIFNPKISFFVSLISDPGTLVSMTLVIIIEESGRWDPFRLQHYNLE
jgi:hypothetical protein